MAVAARPEPTAASLGRRGLVEVTSEAELRALLGAPVPRAVTKERTRLHERDREWLAASPFCLIATAGADGTCDVSPTRPGSRWSLTTPPSPSRTVPGTVVPTVSATS